MLTASNLWCIEWTGTVEAIHIPHAVIFNKTQISVEEVEDLIDNDAWEFDDRIIKLKPKQVKYLEDKEATICLQ